MPNIIKITSFAAPRLDIYARSTERQLLNRHGPDKRIFIAESPKIIGRVLDASCIPISMLMEMKRVKSQAQEIIRRCGEIPVYVAEFDMLTQLTDFHPTQRMLCTMHRPPLPKLGEICAGARRIAVPENVMNPVSMGAMFRSIVTLDTDGILLTSAYGDPLYRRTTRVSMGAVFQIPWTFPGSGYSRPGQGVRRLHELGFEAAAITLKDDSVTTDDTKLVREEKLAIILGTEGDRLLAGTIADCDYVTHTPTSHGVDSLNVAAAGAAAFWQLGRRRWARVEGVYRIRIFLLKRARIYGFSTLCFLLG